ncbi:MAG: CoA transferase, partial [bacterium]
AAFGAEVIHVESTTRPDGMRMVGGMLAQRFDRWWEASAFFHAANTNKRGLALDLSRPGGQELARDLIRHCDALVENFTPRVLESFGLGWDVVHALNPQTIMLRMPAFGLSGPWRDRPGFAQTMEQLSGLAWVTGHADDQPRIQRGPCDPLAGMHAAYAFFLALAERERRGCGMLVEATMVEAALAAASEIAIEWSAHGVLLGRQGNRSPGAAPQGLYACADGTPANPFWLALSVESDEHWRGLLEALDWSPDSLPAAWAHSVGRKADENAIDEHLRRVFAGLAGREALARMEAAGVPAEALADPRRMDRHPQLEARHFFETIKHPVTGEARVPGQAFRFASRPGGWIERPAPTLGQHNGEILGGLLGLSDQKIRELEDAGLIGTALSGI